MKFNVADLKKALAELENRDYMVMIDQGELVGWVDHDIYEFEISVTDGDFGTTDQFEVRQLRSFLELLMHATEMEVYLYDDGDIKFVANDDDAMVSTGFIATTTDPLGEKL